MFDLKLIRLIIKRDVELVEQLEFYKNTLALMRVEKNKTAFLVSAELKDF